MRHGIFAAIAMLAASIAIPMIAATPAAAQSQGQTADFTEAELKSFARAVVEVRRIGQTYQPRMKSAETEADKQAVRQEATTEMAAAIKEEGVTLKRYKEITSAARSDPELANEITGYIKAAQ